MLEFNGDWIMDLKLEKFSLLNHMDYNVDVEKVNQGFFEVEIVDEHNNTPDPEEYQYNTVNWLLDPLHQKAILNKLFLHCKEIIYPQYKKILWESDYPECYPKLNNIKDLKKLLGISRIKIESIEKDNFAYFILDFKSCLDYEHGIQTVFYMDTIIDHGEDIDYKKIFKHRGDDPELEYNKLVEKLNRRTLTMQLPHPKYGKLKPWQRKANLQYPMAIYQAGLHVELRENLENGVIPKEPYTSRILELSIFHKKEELTQYLIKRNPEKKYNSFKYALDFDRYDLMDELLKQGLELNDRIAFDSPFLHVVRSIQRARIKNEDTEKFKMRLKYLIMNGLNPYLEDSSKRSSISIIKDRELRKEIIDYISAFRI